MALPSTRAHDKAYLGLLGDLIAICVEHTSSRIMVVVEQDDVESRASFQAVLEARKIPGERIRFLEVKSLDSIWIRDYGPVVVRRQEDKQLFFVDFAYRDIRLAGEATRFESDALVRPADELVPIWLSTLLNKPYLHPGTVMNGGDLYADGQGLLYTSEETLHLNTGDRDYLTGVFKRYLGVRETRYLRPLPGPAVKHIDMAFKLASPGCCLVGRYATLPGNDELATLQRLAAEVLDENATQLAAMGLRVLRVPMPHIGRVTRWEYIEKVYSAGEREQRILDLARNGRVTAEAVREKLRSTYVYVYRTYLNSLFLTTIAPSVQTGSKSRSLLIVPRYPCLDSADIERQVADVYRESYSAEVEVKFVDAESLAWSNGSLRCIVCTIPQP